MTSPAEAIPVALQRRLPRLFAVLLLGLLALAAWQWRDGPPVSANLLELLPAGAPDALRQQAERRMEEPMNRDLVLLLRHPDETRAKMLVAGIGKRLQGSGLYEWVQWTLQADLPALRAQLLAGRLALLGAAERERLLDDPAAYLEARVQRLYDPFGGFAPVPVEQDWLGLAEAIPRSLPRTGRVGLDLDGGLLTEHDGERWTLLRARTRGDAFEGDLPLRVAAQVAEARETVQAAGGELLAAGGLLYAAEGQRQARGESGVIGGVSSIASLALLLLVFRRVRVLLALLPALVGVLAGAVASVALFGHLHVLTLVLGASLIGVAIDYPLHYLSKSWTLQPWNTWGALRATLPGLTLGLATNAVGYLALSFTPFPALTQVAIFSAAGLLGSYLCAVCLLPALLGRASIVPWPAPLRVAEALLALRRSLLRRVPTPWLAGLLAAFCLGGVAQLSLKDDLRQWIARAPRVQAEAERVGRLVGVQPTSQFFLVRAADGDQLLRRQAELGRRLDRLMAEGALAGYRSLAQVVAPRAEQERLRAGLDRLLAASAPLQALGVDPAALSAEIEGLRQLPPLDIPEALAGPLGEPWRPLWLGTNGDGVAGLVSLDGLSDASRLARLTEGLPGVELVDRLGELNRLFATTQVSAAELKALSCLLIFLLLCLPFGPRGAARALSVSLLGALASLASLGWLGQPLTLFSLFGLLLVTAIGVDYAILMRERVGGAATSLLGTLMAALTTWLSFGLLALSSTPAVSNFGLAVGLGLGFAFLLSPWAADTDEEHAPCRP